MKTMKNLWGFLVVISLIGCSNINGENQGPINNPDGEDASLSAKVVIPLPKTSQTRSVGLTETKNYTNYFEVYFRKNNAGTYVYYSASATANDGNIEINIPVGIYDILLLGGNKSGSNILLLSSSYVVSKNIILEETNVITMTLETVDITINSPTNISVGEVFTPTVKIDTKNPLLNAANNVSMWLYFNNGINSGDTSYQLDLAEITNNVYICELYTVSHLIAPLSLATGTIKAAIRYPAFNVQEYTWWDLSNYSHSDLGLYYQKTVNFIEGQAMPDVEIQIVWPDE